MSQTQSLYLEKSIAFWDYSGSIGCLIQASDRWRFYVKASIGGRWGHLSYQWSVLSHFQNVVQSFLVFVDVRVYSWFATQPERKKKGKIVNDVCSIDFVPQLPSTILINVRKFNSAKVFQLNFYKRNKFSIWNSLDISWKLLLYLDTFTKASLALKRCESNFFIQKNIVLCV